MRFTQRAGRASVVGIGIILTIGCSPFGLVDNADATTEMLDPETIKNQQGVVALYNSSVLELARVMAGSEKNPAGVGSVATQSFVRLVGHVSDEMDYRTTTVSTNSEPYPQLDISTRNFNPNPSGSKHDFFNRLSNLRILAAETQAGFRVYGALLSDTILAHVMAIEASALIMTAELYCSGVPLSTLEYNGDIRMTRGYSTDEVYTFALAKLDTASTLSQGNARISGLINVLRIRVLLSMGRIQEAADKASQVETSFSYQISYPKVALTTNVDGSVDRYYGKFTVSNVQYSNQEDGVERISDRKGSNGLPYASSNDPRVNLPVLKDPWAPLVMASGLEARLAEAEAALKRDDPSWLTILNQLRTSCTSQDACPTPAPAGSGGVPGLGLLEDPGTAEAQLSLLFDERAYWLFLRGFRQGDLRRRIRIYGGRMEELYPIGFPDVGNVGYGYMVSLPVPLDEQQYNPHYKGCLNNDA